MSDSTSIGDRFKGYEKEIKEYLDPNQPIIVRVDGKAFHTYTKGFDQPFDITLVEAMQHTMTVMAERMQGVLIGYCQSDEITLVLSGYESEKSQPWFNGNVQKIASVSASIATAAFNQFMTERGHDLAFFDGRCFNVPDEDEVINCLIWRQFDAERNSVSMLGRGYFSHKELMYKNTDDVKQMLTDIGQQWEDLPIELQRGSCVVKDYYEKTATYNGVTNTTTRSRWVVDSEIPRFVEDKQYIRGRFKGENE